MDDKPESWRCVDYRQVSIDVQMLSGVYSPSGHAGDKGQKIKCEIGEDVRNSGDICKKKSEFLCRQ